METVIGFALGAAVVLVPYCLYLKYSHKRYR